MATAATIDVELRANTARYRAAMLDASRSANQHLGHIRQEAKRTADSFDQLKRAAVGVVTFQALKGSIGQLTQAHKEVQALHLGLRGATGSAAVAADSYSWVSQQAKDLGLDLHTAAQGFMRLTASATPNGVAMEKQRELFLGLSRAATVMQLDTQKVDSAVTALSQSFGKGRFQAEELRQQLGEAIPGILPRFQNAVMAMTEGTELAGESFDSLLQKGLLDTQRFLPAMITAFEGMATGWEEASRSMQAEQNRLGNAWRELKLELGDGAFADGATAALRATTVALEGLSSSLPVVVPLMGSLAAVKLGQSAAAWVQRLNESSAASLRQAVAARNTANELVNKTRRALEDARAEQRRAAAIGGSIAADAQAAEAARVHRNALIQLEAANNRVAVASNRAATMAKATLGFFGGPAGLAFMVASTAASWLVFRDNTDAASRALDNMSGSLKEAVEQFKELDRLQQASILSELRGQVADASRDVNTEVTNMVNQVQNRLRYFGAEAAEAGQQFADSIGKLRAQYAAGGITAGEFNDAVQAQIELLTRNERVASALGGQIAQQGGEVAAAAVKHRELSDRLSGMSGAQREAESAVDGTTEAMRRQQAQADATKAAITSYAQRMAEEVKRGKVQLAQLQGGSAAALKQEFGQFVLDAGGPGAFDPKDLKELVSQYRGSPQADSRDGGHPEAPAGAERVHLAR